MKIKLLYMYVFLLPFVGCKKLIEVPPPVTQLTSENVYTSDATAAAVLTGIYAEMSAATPALGATITSISLTAGLSADELSLYGAAANSVQQLGQFYLNRLNPVSTGGSGASPLWDDFYSKLYIVNIALERLEASNSLTPIVKQQLIGEAKFLRALFYFFLVNLYGDVPLTTSSDYTVNAILYRTPKTEVYQQVIADLKDAQKFLSDGYVGADAKSNTTERVRPNKWAATALLAKVYLYIGSFDSAVAQATTIINNVALYDTTSLDDAFLKNSKEAIWQLQPVNTGWNTEDARLFILPTTGPTLNINHPVYLSSQLLNSFEPGDQRRLDWIDSVIVDSTTYYYPYKYKSATLNSPVEEYLMVLRLGEQYLIRAEARLAQNNFTDAVSDLNTIRTRAGLLGTTANNKTDLLTAILHERQVELFTEWGNRWLDLKRMGDIDVVMETVAPVKGTTWSTDWDLWPIPLYDITQDPNLVQNPGY